MSLTSINIYTLKQIRTKRYRYDLEDYPITCPLMCYEVLQYLLDLKSEPCQVELQRNSIKEHPLFKSFGIISLNSRNKIVGIHRDFKSRIIGTGSIDRLYIEPREVYMAAMDEAHASMRCQVNHRIPQSPER
jgi:hypothetical protein